jgi:hypothetical protein
VGRAAPGQHKKEIRGGQKSSGEGSTSAALEVDHVRTKSSGEGSTRAALEVDQVRTKSSGCTHSLPMPSDAPETTAHAPYFVGSTGARSTQRCTAPMTALKNAPVFRATTWEKVIVVVLVVTVSGCGGCGGGDGGNEW